MGVIIVSVEWILFPFKIFVGLAIETILALRFVFLKLNISLKVL